jgi:hypothetical protein
VRHSTEKLNRRPFRKLPGTREELPAHPYVFAEWERARINIDSRIDLEQYYCSVPYQLYRSVDLPALRPLVLRQDYLALERKCSSTMPSRR